MTKDKWLQVRIGKEDRIRLKQLMERHQRDMSPMVRMVIKWAYENPGAFDYYIAKQEAENEQV